MIPQVYQSAWNNLLVSVQSVSQRLDDQLAFVDRYYATPRPKRKHLFPNVRTK